MGSRDGCGREGGMDKPGERGSWGEIQANSATHRHYRHHYQARWGSKDLACFRHNHADLLFGGKLASHGRHSSEGSLKNEFQMWFFIIIKNFLAVNCEKIINFKFE